MSEKSSQRLSTPFAVVILVGITTIICVGLYWLYLDFLDSQDAIVQEGSSLSLSRSTNQGTSIYTDQEAHFKLTLPAGWMVKESYYYETAAQEKAQVPTVILAKKNQPDSAFTLNQISINLRQSSCIPTDSSIEETKKLGEVTVKTLSYFNQDQKLATNWCSAAEVKGVDVNRKNVNYLFVSYYSDLEVQKVFKEIIQSFKLIPSSGTATPITLGAQENDFTELTTIQNSVDNGSQPWRLDPLAVAAADGVALGFDQENDNFTLVSKVAMGGYSGTGEAMVEAVHGGVIYQIQLIQPVKQGAIGIWAINSVNKK